MYVCMYLAATSRTHVRTTTLALTLDAITIPKSVHWACGLQYTGHVMRYVCTYTDHADGTLHGVRGLVPRTSTFVQM